MNTYQIIPKEFTINGKTEPCTIHIEWDYESNLPIVGEDFEFNNLEDNDIYTRRFENGELLHVWISVKAIYGNLEGCESIGGCHLSSKDFEKDIMNIIKENGLLEGALKDLSINVENTFNKLKYLWE